MTVAALLERFHGAPLSTVHVTPRFRASRHVVVLGLDRRTGTPALVAKVPRLRGDEEGVEREAANLRAVEGVALAPRVVAVEAWGGRRVLVETAVVGTALGPAAVRGDRDGVLRAVRSWLDALPIGAAHGDDWLERIVEPSLRAVEALGADDAALVRETRAVLAPLSAARVPAVFEHGDVSHPNLLRTADGRVAVVDWELARADGVPAHDLFFFLAYASRALGDDTPLPSWGTPFVEAYADRLGVDRALLPALFVCCWARYTAGLLERAGAGEATGAWLRTNRYHQHWRAALEGSAGLPAPARSGRR